MPAITVTVNHSAGLHARPAALFVKMAATFPCAITVRNMTSNKPAANAKSVLSVLTQGVNQGHEVEIAAEGDSAEQALQSLKELVETNFGEGH
jgi:phosphotransferase system HPr (HPr) family protein